jgi:hypothetical protein
MNPDDRPKIDSTLYQLVLEVQAIHTRAEALGMFIDDRELLTCNQCSLTEDVSFESKLYTYFRPNETNILTGESLPEEFVLSVDTGLRFEQITPAQFRCPSCGNLIDVPPDPFEIED